MAVWKLYRYEDRVLVPRMVQSEEGMYLETEPVQVVCVSDRVALVETLLRTLSQDPTKAADADFCDPDAPALPVVLEVLGIRKWKEFEMKALMYTLHKSESSWKMYVTGRGDDGMWCLNDENSRSFPAGQEISSLCTQLAMEIEARLPVKAPRLLGLPGPKSD